MNPEPPPPLRPLSVSSTLLSSPSSIDRPSSLRVVPQCCRAPLGIAGNHQSPLTTPERRHFLPPSHLPVDDLIPMSSVPVTLPGASPVLTSNALSPTRPGHAAGVSATAPLRAWTERSDHAVSSPDARTPASVRGSLSVLDRPTRPRPTRLFGRSCVAGHHVAQVVACAGSRPSTVCKLKIYFLN
jgi:hypothetical protein